MGLTVYGEAGGEIYAGKRGVANVIVNRLHSHHYPDSVLGVCLQPHAFSCWANADFNRANMHRMLSVIGMPDSAWTECLAACMAALVQADNDTTGGATLYHAASMDPKPDWVSHAGVSEIGQIGHQIFYKESWP